MEFENKNQNQENNIENKKKGKTEITTEFVDKNKNQDNNLKNKQTKTEVDGEPCGSE